MIDWMEEGNRRFLESGRVPDAPKVPRKGTAIITCMDARLTRLLPEVLGFDDGDVAVIRNAGGVVRDQRGETMRSVLVAIYELNVRDVVVIAHTDCGARCVTPEGMRDRMLDRGIPEPVVDGMDLGSWMDGLADAEEEVRRTVDTIRGHPLVPTDVRVHGMLLDTATGRVTDVGAS